MYDDITIICKETGKYVKWGEKIREDKKY